jgi:hypothetical protein
LGVGLRDRVGVRAGVRAGVKLRVRVRVRAGARARARARARVRFRVRVRVRVRAGVRVRTRLGGLGRCVCPAGVDSRAHRHMHRAAQVGGQLGTRSEAALTHLLG